MKKKKLRLSVILFVVCIIYILLVKYVDVAPIGPEGSKVGFSTMNQFFKNLFDYKEGWYKATQYIGVLPFLLVGFYGLNGLMQFIKKKDIMEVDDHLLLLAVFYVMVAATYFLFEQVIINYRPFIINGELEASFPSSHTMLALCVCFTSLMISKYYIKSDLTRQIVDMITWVVMIVLVVGRVISGVHWMSDIIGGILISSFLVSLYYESILNISGKKKKKD